MAKPHFSVQIIGDGYAPCKVAFLDMYTKPDERIITIDAGDGRIMYWDTPDQTSIIHTYINPGTFTVTAMAVGNKDMSDPVIVIIKPKIEPQPVLSWWTKLINWLKKLFGV